MGIVLNLIAYVVTFAIGVRATKTMTWLGWLAFIAIVNTVPLFILPEGDPRRMLMFPNTMMHLVLMATARGVRRWRLRRAD